MGYEFMEEMSIMTSEVQKAYSSNEFIQNMNKINHPFCKKFTNDDFKKIWESY